MQVDYIFNQMKTDTNPKRPSRNRIHLVKSFENVFNFLFGDSGSGILDDYFQKLLSGRYQKQNIQPL